MVWFEHRGWMMAGLLSLLLHAYMLHYDIIGPHAWRQTQTLTTALHFAHDDARIWNPQTNYLYQDGTIQRMEFPLYQWLVAVPIRWGIDAVLSARLFSFLLGILSMVGILGWFRALRRSPLLSQLGAWAFLFSPLLHYYFYCPLSDNLALCLAIWGLRFFAQSEQSGSLKDIGFAAACMGLSAAVKLPFVIYFALPLGAWISQPKGKQLSYFKKWRLPATLALLPAMLWYAIAIPSWENNPVLGGTLTMGWTGIFPIVWGNLSSTLPELLLNYASVPFFIIGLLRLPKVIQTHRQQLMPYLWLMAFLMLYYFYEIGVISLVHDYYLMPFMPLLFAGVVLGIDRMLKKEVQRYWMAIPMVLMPVLAGLRCVDRWDLNDPGFNSDLIKYKAELQQSIPHNALVLAGSDVSGHIWLYYLNRRGYRFEKGQLDADRLDAFRKKGVQYVASDVAELHESVWFAAMAAPLKRFGSIQIFRLRTRHGEVR